MRLVVIGGFSLDVLQEHVVKSFSDIPSNGKMTSWDTIPESPFKNAGMPFTADSLGKLYYIAPVADRHGLSVTWQIPSQLGNWKSKPTDYLAHLIGHEAKGSLLAALKEKSWVTACCAGLGGEGYEVCMEELINILVEHTTSHARTRMHRRMDSLSFHSHYRRKVSIIGKILYLFCTHMSACCGITANMASPSGSLTSYSRSRRCLTDTTTNKIQWTL